MDLRLRLSLLARMAFASVVLLSMSAVLAVFAVVFGGMMLGLLLPGILVYVHDAVVQAPHLSAVLPLPPVAVVGGALVWLTAVFSGWSRIAPYTTDGYLFPPSGPVQAVVAVSTLVSLYLLVVEGIVALGLVVSAVFEHAWALWAFGALVTLVSLAGFVTALRTEARRLRERSLDGDSRPSRPADGVDGVVRRLAQQADVPSPGVRIAAHDRPLAFTIGSGATATIVVSEGLLDRLPSEELEAVLAHEVSHLANGDSRLMALALAPVVFAEDLFEDDPDDLGEWFWWLFDRALLLYGQLGVAVLSRGREWAADAGAAALTGSPAALASALVRLDEARGPPAEDLREWSDALVALDVLPTLSPDGTRPGWAFRTHPSTDARVERLRRLAAEMERE